MKADIMADGWSEEVVMRAVNSYTTTAKNAAKAEEKAEETAEEKKQKPVSEYTKANLYAAIRNGDATTAEIKDIVESLVKSSEGTDPMKAIQSALTSEFRDEYMALIAAGKTGQAAKLRKRLEAAGAKSATIDKWEKDAKK